MADTAPMPASQSTAGLTAGASISLRGIRRHFPNGVQALSPIDLVINAGEFVSLLGPSGCGKSTLLRIIAGLDRPTSGVIDSASPSIAYVFQDATLLPWRSVLRNVTLPLELQRMDKAKRLDRAADVLRQVGLADATDRYPAQLSGGMRMRVSLARALVTNPSLLLLDEPFAALDEITRQHLDDQLRALWLSRRMTVVFVTHSTVEAAFLAERAIVLSARPGRIVLDQPIDLPLQRPPEIRSDSHFAAQTRLLFDALAGSGA
jgi:NitT/TauT family transport system ATP-binding protein